MFKEMKNVDCDCHKVCNDEGRSMEEDDWKLGRGQVWKGLDGQGKEPLSQKSLKDILFMKSG